MEKEEYKVMYDIEDNYWWYAGLRKLVLASIDRFACKEGKLRILDAGCGTGRILESCKEYNACGIDLSDEAIKFCKTRSLGNIIQSTICDIPFQNNSFDVVISLDVLYHANVNNDLTALNEFYRVTNKDGIVILNLPAYNFLKSRHDVAIHTKHRYTYMDLKKKIEKAGFRIERLTYRNIILFPLVFIKRMIEKLFVVNNEKTESDLKLLPEVVNKFLTKLLFIENRLILSGLNFPFGLSLYCIAKKTKSSF
ncbi:class I SAM-dependent methyltransferase [candidate division WS5 bacterium]|uniref:Class I SAM-dependent methyltransferase n=1 Tax=candidate division WS5 bacterium TaxID=2093353 RepID=A0A419DBV6_9BACT|nr:MAG: class I SAM-dependent methyltransferase [candidate division WS5 bacterium]